MSQSLEIIQLKAGSSLEIQKGQTAVVHYTGFLENGTKFDSSKDRDETFSFVLGEGMVIAGWEEGVLGMKIGEQRKLIIPADMGYGDFGVPQAGIPPKATLIFEVELVNIE